MGASWTEADIVHLLGRTTFHVSPADVSAALELGKTETVRRLIDGVPLSGEMFDIPPIAVTLADGKELNAAAINDQQTYWLYRMAVSSDPLREKMTLFWHDHFATSNRKVNSPLLMAQQNELFRQKGLGSFHELVVAVGEDPAMLIWLDSNSNKKGRPNENYAREAMELFTLGIGNYTEDDVKEVARAFTGWGIDPTTRQTVYNPKQHDGGLKYVLGETGYYDSKSVVDVLFHQQSLYRFIARSLLLQFATPNPSDEWVKQVAKTLESTETIGEVLRLLFESDEFYNPQYRLSLIKNPAEYVAGFLRAFEVPLSKSYISFMRKMGQELYMPPNVSGWEGGASWLQSSSLLARSQFAESLAKRLQLKQLQTEGFKPERPNAAEDWVSLWMKNAGVWGIGERSQSVLASYADETFVHANSKINGMRGLLQLIMISPEAQMK
jgi:uncharacterized protein (DUF1800 family)